MCLYVCVFETVARPTSKREKEEAMRLMKALMPRTVEGVRHPRRTLLSPLGRWYPNRAMPRPPPPPTYTHPRSASALAALAEMPKELSEKRFRCASAPGRHASFERGAGQVVEKKAGRRGATTISSGPGALYCDFFPPPPSDTSLSLSLLF